MVREDLHTREERLRHYRENIDGYPEGKDYAVRCGAAIAGPAGEGKTGCQACGVKTGGAHKRGCAAGGGTVFSRVPLAD